MTTILRYSGGKFGRLRYHPDPGLRPVRSGYDTAQILVAPMLTAEVFCWALTDVGAAPSASAITAAPRCNPRFVLMCSSTCFAYLDDCAETRRVATNAGWLVLVWNAGAVTGDVHPRRCSD